MSLFTAEQAIMHIQQGNMIIVIDDEKRENEGDLVICAEYATPEIINFMASHGKGLICLALSAAMADSLCLSPMVSNNEAPFGTNFTCSIEAREGISTGISAFDRATTIATAIADNASSRDLVSPGHVFPLRAKIGGVLERPGQTEAGVDLARLAGKKHAAVICEIMNNDGTMARLTDLFIFSEKHSIPIVSIKELQRYRIAINNLAIEKIDSVFMPTQYGDFTLITYPDKIQEQPNIALVRGNIQEGDIVPVRMHSECLTGDTFSSLRCDCGEQLRHSMQYLAKQEKGILLYLRQEGRGIGLEYKIKSYFLQDQGLDTVEANEHLGFDADLREYSTAAQILRDLNATTIQLLSNNPDKELRLRELSINIVEKIPLHPIPNNYNEKYLLTKKEKMGHTL
ncbi:MAG: 3,4-dihydroxy-2-butanone-4-phosphate synthase [Desulfovibrionaceae bacterium]